MNKKHSVRPPQDFSKKDIFERINYLTEISKVAAQDPDLYQLSQYLGNEANQTAQKSKIRIKPKQLFCKNCKTPLVSPLTAEVVKSHNVIHYKCKICKKERKKYLNEKIKTQRSNVQHFCFVQDVSNDQIVTIYSSTDANKSNSASVSKD